MKHFIKKYNHLILFFIILFSIGFFLGISLAIKNHVFLEEHINYFITNINNIKCNYILFHFFVLTVSLFLSFFAISPLFSSTITFYEGMSTSFTITLFTYSLGLKGLIYSLIFTVITKGLYLLISLIFNIKCLNISLNKLKKILFKENYPYPINKQIKGCITCFIIIIIYDILLSIFASSWLGLFKFLII